MFHALITTVALHLVLFHRNCLNLLFNERLIIYSTRMTCSLVLRKRLALLMHYTVWNRLLIISLTKGPVPMSLFLTAQRLLTESRIMDYFLSLLSEDFHYVFFFVLFFGKKICAPLWSGAQKPVERSLSLWESNRVALISQTFLGVILTIWPRCYETGGLVATLVTYSLHPSFLQMISVCWHRPDLPYNWW